MASCGTVFKWTRRSRVDRLAAMAKTQRQLNWDWRSAVVEAAARERDRQLLGQEHVVQAVEALLFRHDPGGINFGENLDEYHAEAQTIMLRLHEAHSVEDVRRITHEEFVRWFDADFAGPAARYQSRIAQEIWMIWSTSDGS